MVQAERNRTASSFGNSGIPAGNIRESKKQPRRVFDEAQIESCGRLHWARGLRDGCAGLLRRLGHEKPPRLFQVYGWEEKKTKTSWARIRSTTRSWRRLEARTHAMTEPTLTDSCDLRTRSRVTPGYSSAEALSKEGTSCERSPLQSRRMRESQRAVTSELSAKEKWKRAESGIICEKQAISEGHQIARKRIC